MLFRSKTGVHAALVRKRPQYLPMALFPLALADDGPVVHQTEPSQILQYGGLALPGRTRAVRILETKEERPPVARRPQVVEKGGARSPDMKRPRRRGGKAGLHRFPGKVTLRQSLPLSRSPEPAPSRSPSGGCPGSRPPPSICRGPGSCAP